MNLILCCTPLQVLIAKKIIELNPTEKFFCILFDSVGNGKYENYFKILSSFSYKSLYIKISAETSNVKRFLELFLMKIKYKNLRHTFFDKIYLANIDNIFVQCFISQLRFITLNTFDDGTANIIKKSHLYKNKNESITHLILRWVLRIKYDIEILKKISSIHYTIYKNLSNIIENTQFIDLSFNSFKNLSSIDKPKEIVKIFLSQPIFSGSLEDEILFRQAHEKFKFNFYFPHPRDINKYSFCKEIDTDLIFEDFILRELEGNDDIEFIVYTFFSSAILNITNMRRIKPIAIIPQRGELNEYLEIYHIFSKNNIKIEFI